VRYYTHSTIDIRYSRLRVHFVDYMITSPSVLPFAFADLFTTSTQTNKDETNIHKINSTHRSHQNMDSDFHGRGIIDSMTVALFPVVFRSLHCTRHLNCDNVAYYRILITEARS